MCLCATVKQGNLEMNGLGSFVEQHIRCALMYIFIPESTMIFEQHSHTVLTRLYLKNDIVKVSHFWLTILATQPTQVFADETGKVSI